MEIRWQEALGLLDSIVSNAKMTRSQHDDGKKAIAILVGALDGLDSVHSEYNKSGPDNSGEMKCQCGLAQPPCAEYVQSTVESSDVCTCLHHKECHAKD